MEKAANDNALRAVASPAEFDRQLALAYPRLLARARRFTTDPQNLVQQTAVAALHRWTNFRQTPGNPYYGFYTWLCWVMKGSAADFKDRASRRIVMVPNDTFDRQREDGADGAQEATADLAAVLSVLAPREREVLLRRAAGDMLFEIAADLGVTKQRVSQIEFEARVRVLDAANDNVRAAA